MLVLSRKKHEKIMIGDDIEIIVVEVIGGRVRLGIKAPKEVRVHRREIYDAIQREKAEKEKEEGQNKAEEKKEEEKEKAEGRSET